MIDYLLSAAVLVQIALLFQVVGLLSKDVLVLRILVLIGTLFYILYYFYIAENPLWGAVFASGVLALANLYMILQLLTERTTFAMSKEHSEIYRNFPTLQPGQFRKLMKISKGWEATETEVLSAEFEEIDRLYLVTDGSVSISKGTKASKIPAPVFIGEVGFLLNAPATANVMADAGAKYVSWDFEQLRTLMASSSRLDYALTALFSQDLATKLGASMPTERDI